MRDPFGPFARNFLRVRANALLQDECVITRPGPSKVEVDPETNIAKRVSGDTIVYEGKCRLWGMPADGKSEYQARDVHADTTRLSIPWDAEMPQINDVVKVSKQDDEAIFDHIFTVQGYNHAGGLRGTRVLTVATYSGEEVDD